MASRSSTPSVMYLMRVLLGEINMREAIQRAKEKRVFDNGMRRAPIGGKGNSTGCDQDTVHEGVSSVRDAHRNRSQGQKPRHYFPSLSHPFCGTTDWSTSAKTLCVSAELK